MYPQKTVDDHTHFGIGCDGSSSVVLRECCFRIWVKPILFEMQRVQSQVLYAIWLDGSERRVMPFFPRVV